MTIVAHQHAWLKKIAIAPRQNPAPAGAIFADGHAPAPGLVAASRWSWEDRTFQQQLAADVHGALREERQVDVPSRSWWQAGITAIATNEEEKRWRHARQPLAEKRQPG